MQEMLERLDRGGIKKTKHSRLEPHTESHRSAAQEMLEGLDADGLTVVMITNGHHEIQREKLARCNADDAIRHVLVGGEEVPALYSLNPTLTCTLRLTPRPSVTLCSNLCVRERERRASRMHIGSGTISRCA